MKFKEWLNINEMGKAYQNYMQRMFPDMPAQVRHELGTNTIVPNLKKIASNRSPITTRQSQLANTVDMPTKPTPSNPYGDTVASDQGGNSKDFSYSRRSTVPQRIPYETPEELLSKNEKVLKFKNSNWPAEPKVFTLHFNDLAPSTQNSIKYYEFGFNPALDPEKRKENPESQYSAVRPVKRHFQRMQDQGNLMQQRSVDKMEPIIMIQQNDGLELLEGWHRMFNFLLSGAPPEIADAIRQRKIDISELDFSNWNPVQIKAFIGSPKNQT